MAHLSEEMLKKQAALVPQWIAFHQKEGETVERYTCAGQLAFFCPNCGRLQTWDSIVSKEKSHYPDEGGHVNA